MNRYLDALPPLALTFLMSFSSLNLCPNSQQTKSKKHFSRATNFCDKAINAPSLEARIPLIDTRLKVAGAVEAAKKRSLLRPRQIGNLIRLAVVSIGTFYLYRHQTVFVTFYQRIPEEYLPALQHFFGLVFIVVGTFVGFMIYHWWLVTLVEAEDPWLKEAVKRFGRLPFAFISLRSVDSSINRGYPRGVPNLRPIRTLVDQFGVTPFIRVTKKFGPYSGAVFLALGILKEQIATEADLHKYIAAVGSIQKLVVGETRYRLYPALRAIRSRLGFIEILDREKFIDQLKQVARMRLPGPEPDLYQADLTLILLGHPMERTTALSEAA